MSKGIRVTKKGNRIDMTESLRFSILERDNFTCQYCGAKASDVKLHVDHIIPIQKGGMTIPSNLVTACEICNSGKRTRIINPDAVVLKEIEFETTTTEGRKRRNTTILFEVFSANLGGLRVIQNETSRKLLQDCLNDYGYETTEQAVKDASSKIRYNHDKKGYDYKSTIEAFKSIPRIARSLHP